MRSSTQARTRSVRAVRLLGTTAAAAMIVSTFSAGTANAAPLEFGALDCSAGTVVGDHIEFAPPAGSYVRDHLTFTPAQAAELEAKTAALAPATVTGKKKIKIPIVWHVINEGASESQGNLPQAKIDDQITHLNQAFAGKESGEAVQTKVKFVLSKVTRTTNATWYNGAHISANERAMKNALHEGGYKTLNLYTTNLTATSGGILGYAYLPAQQVGVLDGVVMERRTVPGGGLPPYDGGDTATHEIGHWMGLHHTFQGGCNAPGDYVDDTPFEAKPDFDCAVGKDSCQQPGTDPVHNYMDYGNDDCLDQFTKGQTTRMKDQYNTYRKGK